MWLYIIGLIIIVCIQDMIFGNYIITIILSSMILPLTFLASIIFNKEDDNE